MAHNFNIGPWVAFELGSSKSTEINRFGIGWGILANGWDHFIDEYIKPAYEYGFRNFLLHRVNFESGHGEGDSVWDLDYMDMDARVDILEQTDSNDPSAQLVSTKELNRFIKRLAKECPDARFIVYVGSIKDEDFDLRAKDHNLSGWLSRFRRSLIPWINHDHIWISFDHASGYDISSPGWKMVELINSLYAVNNKYAFIEALPNPDKPEQHNYSSICLERFWQSRFDGDIEKQQILKGDEIIRWYSGHAYKEGWYDRNIIDWAADVYKTGCIPCISWSQFISDQQLKLLDTYPKLTDLGKDILNKLQQTG